MSRHEPATPDLQYNWTPGADPKTEKEIETFLNSPEIKRLKELICDIGGRLWQRGFVDGNGGNLTIRVGDNLILCTPTLISKGFMKPGDICLVDMDGRQLAGARNAPMLSGQRRKITWRFSWQTMVRLPGERISKWHTGVLKTSRLCARITSSRKN